MTDILTGELVITCPLSRLKEGNKFPWKAGGSVTKSAVHYQKTENINKATSKVFGGFQTKSKVQIKCFWD